MPKKRTITVFIFISLIVFSFFIQTSESRTIDDKPEMLTPQSKDDLLLTLTTNQTTISKTGGALANLTLNNTGINPCGSIEVDFSLEGEYLEFTSKYATHQEIALLNPGSNSTLNVEVSINETATLPERESADVCIIIDASSSMGDEIDSIKAEIQDLIERLQEEISGLRMGVIVYGWNRYSVYPTDNSENCLEFTNDSTTVSDFVDELYAAGGIEPWGDAFYIASTWDWREAVTKEIILIGDEDCDPGRIIGVGETTDYYNGSQLLDIVTTLKNMGVVINTIRSRNETILNNQFTWVAEYTGGEAVDLDEAINGDFPGGIPELIEFWTLELAREYYITVYADVSWTELEPGNNMDHVKQVEVDLVLDLAPPDITVSTLIDRIDTNDYTLEIYATIKDPSGILSANIYWTDDDIDGTPTWHFNMMTLVGDIYYFEMNHLVFNQRVSFYIQASDIVSNVGFTDIYNKTIVDTYTTIGGTLDVLLFEDNSTKYLVYRITPYSECYIWVKSNQSLNLNFTPTDDFSFEEVYTDGFDSLHKITKTSSVEYFALAINGNTSSSRITIHSNVIVPIDEENFDYTYIELDNSVENFLLTVTLTDPASGYISMIMETYYLIAVAYVFDENWNFIGEVSADAALAVDSGTYNIWIIRVLREGVLRLYYDESAYTTDDQYYAMSTNGFETISLVFALTLLCFLTKRRNSGKRKRKKLT